MITAIEKIKKFLSLEKGQYLIKKQGNQSLRIIQEDECLTDFYLSCPIFNKSGELIDLCFKPLGRGYIFRGYNVTVFVQENGSLIFQQDRYTFRVEFIGLRFLEINDNRLVYDNCIIEATFNGVLVKKVNGNCFIKIEFDTGIQIDEKEGTILLSVDYMHTIAMAIGLIDERGNDIRECELKIQKYSTQDVYIMAGIKESKSVMFEISAYCKKLISDTVISQSNPTISSPYAGSVLTYSEEKFEKRLLFRPSNELYNVLKGADNQSTYLYLPLLKNGRYVINKLLNRWCSFHSSWIDSPQYQDRNIQSKEEGNFLKVDLTSEYKKDVINGYGFVLRGSERLNPIMVSTGDSLYFPYIIEINKRGD